MVLQYLGISVAPILTAFGIGGLAVALALQDTLANFFSGIQIAASRQVHAGDFVRIDAEFLRNLKKKRSRFASTRSPTVRSTWWFGCRRATRRIAGASAASSQEHSCSALPPRT